MRPTGSPSGAWARMAYSLTGCSSDEGRRRSRYPESESVSLASTDEIIVATRRWALTELHIHHNDDFMHWPCDQQPMSWFYSCRYPPAPPVMDNQRLNQTVIKSSRKRHVHFCKHIAKNSESCELAIAFQVFDRDKTFVLTRPPCLNERPILTSLQSLPGHH